MTVSHQQKIGTYFKKENIFLATVSASDVDTKELLKSKMDGMDSNVPEDLMAFFVGKGFLSAEQFDIFYRDDTGYTRFVEDGPETFAGDNSDGKGIIRNVVSIVKGVKKSCRYLRRWHQKKKSYDFFFSF